MFYKPPVVLCIKIFNKMQYLNYVKLPQIIIILFSFAHKFLEIRIKQPTSTNVANTDKIMSLSYVNDGFIHEDYITLSTDCALISFYHLPSLHFSQNNKSLFQHENKIQSARGIKNSPLSMISWSQYSLSAKQ